MDIFFILLQALGLLCWIYLFAVSGDDEKWWGFVCLACVAISSYHLTAALIQLGASA